MLQFGARRRRRLPVNAEINLINLVDIAFVLLIIFMITAPILQGGIEVALPQATATPITNAEAVVVSIDERGDVFVEKVRAASLDEFETIFRTYTAGGENRAVSLNADHRVPYGRIMQVIDRLKRLGVTDLGLVVQPTTS
jgi:biopolymer transport protein ExbD/biopolymer transport protein TolR